MADDDVKDGTEEDLWAAAAEDLEEQRQMLRDEAETSKMDNEPEAAVAVSEAPAQTTAPAVAGGDKLDMILDIPLQLTVELGRAKMLINDLLQLGQGSVIELTKLIGEPLEVLINEKLIAKGEVVVVNEKFGVRLTEVISHTDRIESMT